MQSIRGEYVTGSDPPAPHGFTPLRGFGVPCPDTSVVEGAADVTGGGVVTRARAGIYIAFAAVAVLLASVLPTTTSAATTLTFTAVADGQVALASPGSTYGTTTSMRTREGAGTSSDPTYRSYLRFDVSGVAGQTIQSVTLRLFATDASPNGQGVHRVPNPNWSEATLSGGTAPAFDATALATAPVPLAAYNDIALPTSAIAGDGLVSFAVKSTGNNNAAFNTREATANRPQLVIVTADSTPTRHAHRDAHAHRNADAHGDTGTDADARPNPDARPDPDADRDRDADSDADRHTDPDPHPPVPR